MPIVDIVLVGLICAFALFGFFSGFVYAIGSLIGTIVASVLAFTYIDVVFGYIGPLFGGGAIARVSVFFLLFFLISRVFGILFWLFRKLFHFLSWIPFAGIINRLLGGLLGVVEGVILVGVAVYYAEHVLPASSILSSLQTSAIAKQLLDLVTLFQMFFPALAKYVFIFPLKK